MFLEQLQFIGAPSLSMALHGGECLPWVPLYGGRAVRNLVGRPAGALRGRKGLGFDIHQIL